MTAVRRQPESAAGRRPVRRKRRMIHVRRFVLSVLLLLFGVELVLAVLTSPWFYVKTVRVEGRRTIPLAEIAGSLHVPPKSNLFLFQTERIVRKLELNPAVQNVVVRRRLPGTIMVQVFERRAQLILSSRGRLYAVDSDGLVFCAIKEPLPGVPVVQCSVPGRIAVGKKVEAPKFLAARRCLQLAEEKKNFRVAKITVDQNNDLCLNVRDGPQIRLGQAERLSEKLDIAGRAAEQIPGVGRRAEYIDVTCPEAPALKLREKT